MLILAVVLCIPLLALGGINLVQASTGRQVLRPGSSRRLAQQIRRESAYAAVEMLALAVAVVAIALGATWVALASFLIALAAFAAIPVARRRGLAPLGVGQGSGDEGRLG